MTLTDLPQPQVTKCWDDANCGQYAGCLVPSGDDHLRLPVKYCNPDSAKCVKDGFLDATPQLWGLCNQLFTDKFI